MQLLMEHYFAKRETWNTLQPRLAHFSREQTEAIDTAYQIAKSAHRTQKREGGDRYFEHPRAIALIFLDELKTNDHELIVGAFLHDVAEDTAVFGNSQKIRPYSEWRRQVRERLIASFGENVSEMVIAVTKPEVDGIEIMNNNQAHDVYIEQLFQSSPKAILLKMADRLHNLRTLGDCSNEKQQRKITETQSEYFPIFDKAFEDYPLEAGYLFEHICWEIEKLQSSSLLTT